MHYSRHRITASWSMWLHSRTRQPISIGLGLLAHWSNRQKLNRASSVQLRRSVRAFTVNDIQSGPKMAPFIVRLITSSNINRFSNFFHCQNQETICNETVTIDPTKPQIRRYTTSCNVRWRTQAGDTTDQLRDQRWSSLTCGPQTTQT